MSCDTNKVTVLGDFDVNDRRGGRHRHHDDKDWGRDFDAQRDLCGCGGHD